MNKAIVIKTRRRLTVLTVLIVLIVAVSFIYEGADSYHREQSDKNATETLDSLTLSKDNANVEITQLKNLLKGKYISNEYIGEIYKSLAEISYMSGDEIEYNEYVTNAIFYLEKSNNNNVLMQLYIQYIGRLYANGSYDSIVNLLKDISDIHSMEDNIDPLIAATYYESWVDVLEMQGNTEEAEHYLEMSQKYINAIDADNARKALQQAKYDMLSARLAIIQGDITKAENIMSGYHKEDLLGLPENNIYLICDYTIPYYELNAKLMLINGNTDGAYEYIDGYLEFCDSYNFRMMKLNLLDFISGYFDEMNTEKRNEYDTEFESYAKNTLMFISDKYGESLLKSAELSSMKLVDQESEKHDSVEMFRFTMVLIGLIVLFLFIMDFVIDYMNVDGLTRMYNRKEYDRIIKFLNKFKKSYSILIFDIDDFKKINDKYGHDNGDLVLKAISNIILKYTNHNIKAFRFGGEEMCIIFNNMSIEQAFDIADTIRKEIEEYHEIENIRITVSGGLSFATNGDDAFRTADKCLYVAKNNGKNQIIAE